MHGLVRSGCYCRQNNEAGSRYAGAGIVAPVPPLPLPTTLPGEAGDLVVHATGHAAAAVQVGGAGLGGGGGAAPPADGRRPAPGSTLSRCSHALPQIPQHHLPGDVYQHVAVHCGVAGLRRELELAGRNWLGLESRGKERAESKRGGGSERGRAQRDWTRPRRDGAGRSCWAPAAAARGKAWRGGEAVWRRRGEWLVAGAQWGF
eukprot:SM000027S09657  [mRNA]  locus=s27:560907:564789:- [translate_table: standard]